MPNWCSNSLTITDLLPIEVELIKRAIDDDLFRTFVPEPNWTETPNENGDVSTYVDRGGYKSLQFPDGKTDERWYDWRVANWGSKWGVHKDDMNVNVFGDVENANEMCIRFDTAWAPPIPFIEVMSTAFPNAKFTCTFTEEAGFFTGVALFSNGEYEEDSYIPDDLYANWLKEVKGVHKDDIDDDKFLDEWYGVRYEFEDRTMEILIEDCTNKLYS